MAHRESVRMGTKEQRRMASDARANDLNTHGVQQTTVQQMQQLVRVEQDTFQELPGLRINTRTQKRTEESEPTEMHATEDPQLFKHKPQA